MTVVGVSVAVPFVVGRRGLPLAGTATISADDTGTLATVAPPDAGLWTAGGFVDSAGVTWSITTGGAITADSLAPYGAILSGSTQSVFLTFGYSEGDARILIVIEGTLNILLAIDPSDSAAQITGNPTGTLSAGTEAEFAGAVASAVYTLTGGAGSRTGGVQGAAFYGLPSGVYWGRTLTLPADTSRLFLAFHGTVGSGAGELGAAESTGTGTFSVDTDGSNNIVLTHVNDNGTTNQTLSVAYTPDTRITVAAMINSVTGEAWVGVTEDGSTWTETTLTMTGFSAFVIESARIGKHVTDLYGGEIGLPAQLTVSQAKTRAEAVHSTFQGVYDYASLFAGGELGGAWDLQVDGTVWQDRARTTAATTRVGAVDDLSGNGNHIVAPTDAKRFDLITARDGSGLVVAENPVSTKRALDLPFALTVENWTMLIHYDTPQDDALLLAQLNDNSNPWVYVAASLSGSAFLNGSGTIVSERYDNTLQTPVTRGDRWSLMAGATALEFAWSNDNTEQFRLGNYATVSDIFTPPIKRAILINRGLTSTERTDILTSWGVL